MPTRTALALVVALLSAPLASAQQVVRDDGTPVHAPMLVRPVPTASDPNPQFVAWLNGVRSSRGLAPVSLDAAMVADAAENSRQQSYRGLGHWWMGHARRQNSGMGPYSAMAGMWWASGPHRSALLDPSVKFVGLAGAGAYWTLSLR